MRGAPLDGSRFMSPPELPVRPVRRSVVWLARLFVVVLSATVGIGSGEILLRMQQRSQDKGLAGLAARDPAANGLPEIEGVFALAQPNVRARYRSNLYETNSRGLRGPEYSLDPAPGSFRIEMIGDSYTMGSGVRREEAYPSLVEEGLNRTGESVRYEVMNLGLSGLSLAASIDLRLKPVGLEYHPDLLVYGFTVNDLEGPDYRTHPRYPFAPSGSLLLDLLHTRWDYLRDIVHPGPSSYVRELDDNFFENPKVWARFTSDLDRLAAIGRERGVCVVVLVHAQLTALGPWHPFLRHYEAVERAARERGMYVVQSFPWFEGLDPAAYRCSEIDWHPNAMGHEILAESLLRGLRSLPAECWKSSRIVSKDDR